MAGEDGIKITIKIMIMMASGEYPGALLLSVFICVHPRGLFVRVTPAGLPSPSGGQVERDPPEDGEAGLSGLPLRSLRLCVRLLPDRNIARRGAEGAEKRKNPHG
jgi:hypothetical protein